MDYKLIVLDKEALKYYKNCHCIKFGRLYEHLGSFLRAPYLEERNWMGNNPRRPRSLFRHFRSINRLRASLTTLSNKS